MRYLKRLLILLMTVCGAWADSGVVSAVAAPPLQPVIPQADTSVLMLDSAIFVLTAPAPDSASSPSMSYTGAALSAFLPGGGQFYHGRPYWGGALLAAEATAIVYAVVWGGEYGWRRGEAGRMRDSAAVVGERGSVSKDSVTLYLSGLYSVYGDRIEFEARQAKYNMYNAITYAAALHVYGFFNALELDGLVPRGEEKSPGRAGALAAVPFLGLGQHYNGRHGKAAMLGMAQASFAVTAGGYHQLMGLASGRYNDMRDTASAMSAYRAEHLGYWKDRYDNSFSQRNTFLWLTLFTYLYSIFDAVVDAHLSDYEERIGVGTDLALWPGGAGVYLSISLGRVKRF